MGPGSKTSTQNRVFWNDGFLKIPGLVNVNKKLLKLVIEIVDFPIKNGGSFHSYVTNYQRVSRPLKILRAKISGMLGASSKFIKIPKAQDPGVLELIK